MNDKHTNRIIRGFITSIIPIGLTITQTRMGTYDFFKFFFIVCLIGVCTYLQGLIVEKFYMKK